jgi:pyruvate-ferredoxin/flavodoxin oxidoreductase
LRSMLDEKSIHAHRKRALSPDHPVLRGTAQNPDVYFQARETVNPFYNSCPDITQQVMDKFADLTGRQYNLFEYSGDPQAERVVVMMGCGAITAAETAKHLNKQGEKVGIVNVRLYRPFSIEHFIKLLPETTKIIAVLDRTKEPGAAGEPLYTDVVTSLNEGMTLGLTTFKQIPRIIGGRYAYLPRNLRLPW